MRLLPISFNVLGDHTTRLCIQLQLNPYKVLLGASWLYFNHVTSWSAQVELHPLPFVSVWVSYRSWRYSTQGAKRDTIDMDDDPPPVSSPVSEDGFIDSSINLSPEASQRLGEILAKDAAVRGLLSDINAVNAAHAKEAFTELFQRGCALLQLDDEAAARVFDTSRTTASRWRRGKVVPPAAKIVLRMLKESLEAEFGPTPAMKALYEKYGQ